MIAPYNHLTFPLPGDQKCRSCRRPPGMVEVQVMQEQLPVDLQGSSIASYNRCICASALQGWRKCIRIVGTIHAMHGRRKKIEQCRRPTGQLYCILQSLHLCFRARQMWEGRTTQEQLSEQLSKQSPPWSRLPMGRGG